MNEKGEVEDWFSRAKKEADKDIPFNDRVNGIVLVIASVLAILYFAAHQIWLTGFFTLKFGMLEMILLYRSLFFGSLHVPWMGYLVKDYYLGFLMLLAE